MPTKKITDLFCGRVKPPKHGRVEYFDAAFGGLALRVTDRGRKTWSLHYRFQGRLRRLTIGGYPSIRPSQARREASEALERARSGVDPGAEKQARRLQLPVEADTFAVLLNDYLERHARKNLAATSFNEARRLLERDVLPRWRKRPISSITRRDVIDLVDRISERGAQIQANRTLAWVRVMFNWAVAKDRLPASPAAGIKAPTKERTRDRFLTDDELRWFWRSCDEIGWPFGPLFKLLLMTAQRRDEVGGIEWADVDLEKRAWIIPRHKAKNNRAHEVQLSAAAIEVLRGLPQIGTGLVFTTTGKSPVSGFSRAKAKLDSKMTQAKRAELGKTVETVPEWRLHDLRRTAATGMARLNIAPHVVDKVLNHSSGTIRGVAAVYNRFEYLEERRAALEAWGRSIASLIMRTEPNVLTLRREPHR
jgi:integrase